MVLHMHREELSSRDIVQDISLLGTLCVFSVIERASAKRMRLKWTKYWSVEVINTSLKYYKVKEDKVVHFSSGRSNSELFKKFHIVIANISIKYIYRDTTLFLKSFLHFSYLKTNLKIKLFYNELHYIPNQLFSSTIQ